MELDALPQTDNHGPAYAICVLNRGHATMHLEIGSGETGPYLFHHFVLDTMTPDIFDCVVPVGREQPKLE